MRAVDCYKFLTLLISNCNCSLVSDSYFKTMYIMFKLSSLNIKSMVLADNIKDQVRFEIFVVDKYL